MQPEPLHGGLSTGSPGIERNLIKYLSTQGVLPYTTMANRNQKRIAKAERATKKAGKPSVINHSKNAYLEPAEAIKSKREKGRKGWRVEKSPLQK